MKLKRLTCLITILAFSGQTLLLSGCAEGAGGASATGSNANPPVGGEENLNDHRLWTNITGYDNTSKGSQLDLSFNNNSSNDLELVGCDNDPTIKNNLESNIPGLFAAQRTKKFDSKWSAYANSTGSILDAKHIPDNNLSFNGSSSRNYNCYYRIFHPEAGAFLYVKLNAQEVKLATHGAGTVGQPNIDMKALADSSMGAAVKGGDLKLSDLSKPLDWSSQKNAQMSLINYTDKKIYSGVNNQLDVINQNLMILNATSNNLERVEFDPNFYWLTQIHTKEKLLGQLGDVFGCYGQDAENLVKDLESLRYRVTQKDWEFSIKNLSGQKIPLRESTFYVQNPDDFKKLPEVIKATRVPKFPDAKELALSYEQSAGIAPRNVADIIEQTSYADAEFVAGINQTFSIETQSLQGSSLREIQAEIDSGSSRVGTIVASQGEDLAGAVAERATATEMGAVAAAGIAAGVVFGSLAVGEGIQQLVNYFSGSGTNGKGNSHSTMAMLSLDAPSGDEVAKWNASHDESHQLEDNTRVTSSNPDDAHGGNNSLSQSMRFTFKDPSIDQQIGNVVSLNNISSPWIRGYSKEDPFVGDVSETSAHQTDAVVGVSVNELNNVSPVKDAAYAYNNQRLANIGIAGLGQDLRFDAPSYSVQKVVNTKTNSTIYKAGTSQGLLGSRNGMLRINGIDGLVINSGEQTTMNVQIPASSLSRLKGMVKSDAGALNYGQGLGASLVSQEESGAMPITPVKSDMFLSQSKNESSVQPFFYNKFSCSYPLRVGDNCAFTMMVGGTMDGKKHLQNLYLADGNSKTAMIPVYVNYNLVSEPQSQELSNGDNTPVKILVKNFSSAAYDRIIVSGLPSTAILLANSDGLPSCSASLGSQQSCELSYDLSGVDSGSYSMVIYGAKNGDMSEIPSADAANANGFSLTIDGGF